MNTCLSKQINIKIIHGASARATRFRSWTVSHAQKHYIAQTITGECISNDLVSDLFRHKTQLLKHRKSVKLLSSLPKRALQTTIFSIGVLIST